MNVDVVLAYPEKQYLVTLTLLEGATIRQAAIVAFQEGILPEPHAESDIHPETVALGIFGELQEDAYVLNEGDRVEIYRPLLQDPKEWRRQRAKSRKER